MAEARLPRSQSCCFEILPEFKLLEGGESCGTDIS